MTCWICGLELQGSVSNHLKTVHGYKVEEKPVVTVQPVKLSHPVEAKIPVVIHCDKSTKVVDSRKRDGNVLRRRECIVCGLRYSTLEVIVTAC